MKIIEGAVNSCRNPFDYNNSENSKHESKDFPSNEFAVEEVHNISQEKRMLKVPKPKPKLRESNKQKGKGRISVPDDTKNQPIQTKYEDLRKMPFSLADEDVDQIQSPMQRFLSAEDNPSNADSLHMEAENDHELLDCYDGCRFHSLDFDEENIS